MRVLCGVSALMALASAQKKGAADNSKPGSSGKGDMADQDWEQWNKDFEDFDPNWMDNVDWDNMDWDWTTDKTGGKGGDKPGTDKTDGTGGRPAKKDTTDKTDKSGGGGSKGDMTDWYNQDWEQWNKDFEDFDPDWTGSVDWDSAKDWAGTTDKTGGKGGGDKPGMDKGDMKGDMKGGMMCQEECQGEMEACQSRGMKGEAIKNCVGRVVMSDTESDCKTCVMNYKGDKSGKGMDKDKDSGMGMDKDSGKGGKGDQKPIVQERVGGGGGPLRNGDLNIDDCAKELEACEGSDNSSDGYYRCLILEADKSKNMRCGGFLTYDEETGEGDIAIGMNCLQDLALCAALEMTAMTMFDDCLIPAIEGKTASEKCIKAYHDMNPMATLERKAIEACVTESTSCLGTLGLQSLEDLDETNSWDMMECVSNMSQSDACSTAVENLMSATTCIENMTVVKGSDGSGEVKACVEGAKGKDDRCALAYAETKKCDQDRCMFNKKTGHCYSKHSKGDEGKDKEWECQVHCETYVEGCIESGGKMDKKAMSACIMEEAGESSECGTCMASMMEDKPDKPEKPDMEQSFADTFDGDFDDFLLYCSRQKTAEKCNACSGRFRNDECTAPTKKNRVRCQNMDDLKICAAIGCDVKNNQCKGKPKFN